MRKSNGFTVAELVLVIAIFAIMTAVLAPFVRMVKNRSDEIACANNLRQISLGLHMYAADNDGNFPAGLGAIYPKYVNAEKAFDCPAGKSDGTPRATRRFTLRIRGTPDEPDYNYIAGLTESSDPSEVIVYDLDDNHGGRLRNILRINGRVEEVRGSSGKPR